MCRKAFPLLLVVTVMAGVPTNCYASGQEEVLLTITANQFKILDEINTVSSVCSSCDSGVQEIRLMKEGMLAEMREVKEVLKAVQSPQPSPQPDSLDILHNDTNISLCGGYKVLHGSKGFLSSSHPWPYQHNIVCEWHVVLPQGTRPAFTWQYLDTEDCSGWFSTCGCDDLRVASPSHQSTPVICGDTPPTTHPMYNIMDNEFRVIFESNTYVRGKGFLLHYSAVPVPRTA